MRWLRRDAPAAAMAGREATDGADRAALVAQLLGGDAQVLDRLYRLESGPVYRYALALCGNPAWAADAMQDAFVAFAGRPAGWEPGRGSLGAYLAGSARFALLARWRDARRHVELAEPDDDAAAAPGDAASPEALLVRAQDQAAVWEALQALPWGFREAIVLVDLQERSYAEAARIAGLELNTLRTRLHRARSRLATLLAAGQGVPA
jgi:RNA polymerase sigma-70 factor (ECF subfamily)